MRQSGVPKQSHNEDAAYHHGRLMSAHDNTLNWSSGLTGRYTLPVNNLLHNEFRAANIYCVDLGRIVLSGIVFRHNDECPVSFELAVFAVKLTDLGVLARFPSIWRVRPGLLVFACLSADEVGHVGHMVP